MKVFNYSYSLLRDKQIESYSAVPTDEVVTLNQPQKKFDYEGSEVLLDVRHLKQFFRFGKGEFKYNKAVNNVSFKVYKGEVFGLVGESGCGKTTTGRSIIKLYKITSGDVWFKGVRIAAGTRWNEKEIKYTRIGLNKTLNQNKLNENEELSALNSEFFDRFNEPFNFKKVKNEVEAKLNDVWDEKEPYLGRFEEIKNKYLALNSEAIERANEIIRTQRAKIASAKHIKDHSKTMAKEEIDKLYKEYLENKMDEKTFTRRYKEAKNSSITSKIQMIFQDPIASLNPRMTVRNIIAEGLHIKGIRDKEYITEQVNRVLELVGLVPEHANRYPHEFSGGQRQRIGIARAIIMNPELIIADEPVSALDVSIQAQVINLLNDLRNNLGLTILFIAHNLSVVKYFCDRIAVMYYGNIVELATSEELFAHPVHPYTKSLLSAVPHPDPNIEKNRKRILYNANASHDYSKQRPTLRELVPGHFVYCNDEEEARYLEEFNLGESDGK